MISNVNTKDRFTITSTTPVASYSITFKIWDITQVSVLVQNEDGVVRTINSSNYSVTLTNSTTTLSFIQGFAFESDDKILTIVRVLPLTQTTDYENGDYFNADNLEMSLDKIVSQIQQEDEKVQRSIAAPATDDISLLNLSLPAAVARKNMLLGFSADGNTLIPVLTTDIEQKLTQALEAEETAIEQARNASTSANLAETAKGIAVDAKNDALDAQAAAEDAQGIAENAKSDALDAQAAASQSATNASTSENNAAQTLTSLNEKYVGASATAPTSPVLGTTWFDTTVNKMKVYTGTEWVIAYKESVSASNVAYNNESSGLTATSAQAAIDELKVNEASFIPKLNIVNDLSTGGANNVLSAEQGKTVKTQLDSHTTNTTNPHSVTKAQLGLSNVDNTSDTNKPISTATQTALDNKVDKVADSSLMTSAEKTKLGALPTRAELTNEEGLLLPKTYIVNDLNTDDDTKVLSAKQGKALNDNKLNIDGYSALARVGTADDLAGKGDSTPSSFTHRTAGGSDDISDGVATIEKLKGNSIVWNQLFSQYVSTFSDKGLTFTNNGDGSYNLVGTTTDEYDRRLTTVYGIQSGHKYVVKATKGLRFYVDFQGGASSGVANYGTWATEFICTSPLQTTTLAMRVWMRYAINTTVDITNANLIVFDLTKMFGAGNEPTTVEEFKSLFPKDYYAYNAGELLSFTATGIKTVGFNQFNLNAERIETFGRATINGIQISITGTYYCAWNIKLLPQTYYINYTILSGTMSGIRFLYTDNTLSNIVLNTGIITATKEVKQIILYCSGGTTATTVYENVCINLSWSGIRNGEYKQYWTQTKNLPIETYFPSGMRSAGEAFDELTNHKAITRIGSRAFQAGDDTDTTVLTDGTTTFYALTTPSEVTIEPPLNLGYKVSDFGTEEIISDSETEPQTAPCNLDIVYGLNAVDTLRNLDINYMNVDTLDALLAVLGTACNGTFTKAWNETDRKYTFTFVANA